MATYLRTLVAWQRFEWNRFWFTAVSSSSIAKVRIALSLTGLFWVLVHWDHFSSWTGPEGLWDLETTAAFFQDDAQGVPFYTSSSFKPSLFYVTSNPTVEHAYFVTLIVALVLSVLGMGGRIVPGVVLLGLLGIMHRLHGIHGISESILALGFFYLSMDPGKTDSPWRPGIFDRAERVSSNIATKLLQGHLLLWLALCLVSQLSSDLWWEGEASWWLIASDRSLFFRPEFWVDHPILINLLTHGTTVALLGSFLVLSKRLRPIGWLFQIVYWMSLGILGSEVLYSLAGMSISLIYYTSPKKAISS